MRRKSTVVFFVAMFIATGMFGFILPAGAEVSNPTVTGPIPVTVPLGDPSHDYPQFATQLDLASYGYVEEEFFLEGEATRYATPPLADGIVVSIEHSYIVLINELFKINKSPSKTFIIFLYKVKNWLFFVIYEIMNQLFFIFLLFFYILQNFVMYHNI